MTSYRKLENGSLRLLETGDILLLESVAAQTTGVRLTQDGETRILENGGRRIFEGHVPFSDFLLAIGTRKKLGKPEYDDPLNVYGIYQSRMTQQGKKSFKLRFYTPTNPQTAPQQANRAKFAAAMTAWKALTDEQKAPYTIRAKKLGMFGRNLFIREYFY